MVDAGAESTWINATVLDAIGIERRKKDLQFQLANGQIITRSVGYAVLTVNHSETEEIRMLTTVRRLCGHASIGPRGVEPQSKLRIRVCMSGWIILASAKVCNLKLVCQLCRRNGSVVCTFYYSACGAPRLSR